MMQHDWRGLEITRASDAARAAVDDFAEGFLAYEPRAARVLTIADAEPDCPLVQAYSAFLHMFAETRTAPDMARLYLDRALAASAGATPRERLVIEAARSWIDNDVSRAIRLGEQASFEYPRDLALAKITQYHLFNLGDFSAMRQIAAAVLPANTTIAYAHGLLAFGQEQCHALAEAERSARTALTLRPDEAWAQHALAHVMLTEGRHAEARGFLEQAKHGWARLNSFMHTHNYWHLALVQIAEGDAASVLDYYDDHIWGVWKTYSQDQIGAVSLLARLELAGIDVGDRWDDVARYLAQRVDDHVQPFLSMHYVYGLARAGRAETDDMLAAIRRTAERARAPARDAWADVCVPACEGLVAYARGDWNQAAQRLMAVMPRLAEIGGSHAQRDLFVRLALAAKRREGAGAPRL